MTLLNNLRYAVRQLRKNPGFTITVLATLGLCIGANTAIYTVVDTLFFRALPYPDPDRLVLVSSIFYKGGVSETDTSQTGLQWELVRDHATYLDSAVYGGTSGVNLFASGRVEYVQQQRVSAGFFHVLGIHPLIGREFTRQEDVPGGPPLTILGYEIWRRVFRGDPSIVGRTVDLRGAPHTVVGVMPQGFRADQQSMDASVHGADLWTPLQPSTSGEGGGDNYGIIARLKPGIAFPQADGQLNSIMQPVLKEAHFPPGVSMQEKALPLQLGLTNDIRSKINLMWGAVGLVLLIGCVNIAGILLARSAARSREIATRIALGAGRAQVISQLLAESVLLALGGGLIGLLIGEFALKALVALNPGQFEMWAPLHLDARVMAVMLAVSLSASILFGLFPAFEAASVDLRSALSEGGRGSAGGRRQWKRQALVFLEVTLGVVLVVGAGLLIRTFAVLVNANPGFNPNHVMTASLSLQDARYQTTAAVSRLFHQSLDQIQQIPGVESAAVALSLPYERPLNLGIKVPGDEKSEAVNFTYATPGMFQTLQIPLQRGRLFTDADNTTAAKVAVVNQAFIKRHLPRNPEPLGTHFKSGDTDYQIIGIVSNVQQKIGWGGYGPLDAFPQVYVPADQVSGDTFALAHTWFSPSWMVRTHGDVAGLPDQMRHALQAVDPRLPFSAFHTMSQVRGASLQQQRYQAALFSALAGLAILLAALGVYGLIAQSVAQRTREMGIRLALGATAQGVIRSAAAPGILLSVAGIAAGLILALFATRLLKSLIWGVPATDPLTFSSVAVLLIAVATFASVIPALRLARLDPSQTLRNE
ncbi:MAG: ABC transporter permease [Bryobacteraceae bacterium]